MTTFGEFAPSGNSRFPILCISLSYARRFPKIVEKRLVSERLVSL